MRKKYRDYKAKYSRSEHRAAYYIYNSDLIYWMNLLTGCMVNEWGFSEDVVLEQLTDMSRGRTYNVSRETFASRKLYYEARRVALDLICERKSKWLEDNQNGHKTIKDSSTMQSVEQGHLKETMD